MGHRKGLSKDLRQEARKIARVMVDVGVLDRGRRDVDGAHSQFKRSRKVARFVFKHGRNFGTKTVLFKHGFKGLSFRLGAKFGVFDAIHRVKKLFQSAGTQDTPCVRFRAVGVHDPTSGKLANIAYQLVIHLEMIERYFVNFDKVRCRICAMFLH